MSDDEPETYIPKPPKYWLKKLDFGEWVVLDNKNNIVALSIRKNFRKDLKSYGICEENDIT